MLGGKVLFDRGTERAEGEGGASEEGDVGSAEGEGEVAGDFDRIWKGKMGKVVFVFT